MKQQINLFQPQFQRPREYLSGIGVLKSVAVFSGLMVLTIAVSHWQRASISTGLRQLQAIHQTATDDLERVRGQYPARANSRLLEQELGQLETEVARRQKLLAALVGKVIGSREGFSDHLSALARQHVEGTWLTGVSISRGGRGVALSGASLAPELVPVYLQRLAEESTFTGKTFSELELKRPDDDALRVDFSISTHSTTPGQGSG